MRLEADTLLSFNKVSKVSKFVSLWSNQANYSCCSPIAHMVAVSSSLAVPLGSRSGGTLT